MLALKKKRPKDRVALCGWHKPSRQKAERDERMEPIRKTLVS